MFTIPELIGNLVYYRANLNFIHKPAMNKIRKNILLEGKMAKEKTAKLSICGLGLGLGIMWGISMIVAGWTSMFGWGNLFVNTMQSIYIGYEASFIGGIIGGLWGFVDGFIGGVLISFFYNVFRKN